jgi:hypothetical protein
MIPLAHSMYLQDYIGHVLFVVSCKPCLVVGQSFGDARHRDPLWPLFAIICRSSVFCRMCQSVLFILHVKSILVRGCSICRFCMTTYVHTYATYLLTYGAEPFLRSHQLCSPSRTPQHFIELEGSIPCSQEPSRNPSRSEASWECS